MKKLSILLVISVIVLIPVIMSCSGSGNEPESFSDNNITDDEYESDDIDGNESDNVNNYAEESVELPIYTIDNNLGCVPSTALISQNKKIDAELIVYEVTANFAEKVDVYKVEDGKDYVAVYFNEDKAPLKNVSKEMEEAMLDCIAYSLIDNLDYCSNVYYRCSDSNYTSDNISLDYNEPYVTR